MESHWCWFLVALANKTKDLFNAASEAANSAHKPELARFQFIHLWTGRA